jgi:hypothetical protein
LWQAIELMSGAHQRCHIPQVPNNIFFEFSHEHVMFVWPFLIMLLSQPVEEPTWSIDKFTNLMQKQLLVQNQAGTGTVFEIQS